MEVFGFKNRPFAHLEIMSEECLTETIGYIPINKRIQEMQLAGYRLQGYREGLYDDTEDIDPTRNKGLDLADLTQLARAVGRRLGEQKRQALEAEAEKIKSTQPQTPPVAPPAVGGGT